MARDNDRRDSKRDGTGKEETKVVHVIEVKRHDGQGITVPDEITLLEASQILAQKAEEEEQTINFSEKIFAFPWDGALALVEALNQKFGIVIQNEGFFGANVISVETGPNGETTAVPWGSFEVPGIEGTIGCSADVEDGRLIFVLRASVKRKHQKAVQEVAKLTREIFLQKSIYRGKAFEMKFRDEDGNLDKSAQPKFMDLSDTEPVIFSEFIEQEIETNVMSLIVHTEVLRARKMPVSRKVLFAGDFGTGKTLLARNIAKKAQDNGWTFAYVKAEEITDALEFVKTYGRTVVFVEDIDRVAKGERDEELDRLSYALDGINSKGTEVIVIMTTNKPEDINPVIRRAGRIDITIFLDTPDAEAVTRLVRTYGRDSIDPSDPLNGVGEVLAGQIPAVIREVVEQSKLRAITRTKGQNATTSAEDLIFTAESYLKAKERLAEKTPAPTNYLQELGRGIGQAVGASLANHFQQVHVDESQNGHHAHASISV